MGFIVANQIPLEKNPSIDFSFKRFWYKKINLVFLWSVSNNCKFQKKNVYRDVEKWYNQNIDVQTYSLENVPENLLSALI